jgi:SHAQKYF class myb-like DNA-binding protein
VINEESTVVSAETTKTTENSMIPSSPGKEHAGKEHVGRWSEKEHLVFLEGLQKYGKQWKTIAGMIGTRTVVQVRTHAQKYFQKMERNNQQEDGGGGGVLPTASSGSSKQNLHPKRKSLPGALPSQHKKTKKNPPRLSLSLGTNGVSTTVASAPARASSQPAEV